MKALQPDLNSLEIVLYEEMNQSENKIGHTKLVHLSTARLWIIPCYKISRVHQILEIKIGIHISSLQFYLMINSKFVVILNFLISHSVRFGIEL